MRCKACGVVPPKGAKNMCLCGLNKPAWIELQNTKRIEKLRKIEKQKLAELITTNSFDIYNEQYYEICIFNRICCSRSWLDV